MRYTIVFLFLLNFATISYSQDNTPAIRAAQVFHSEATNYIEFEKEIVHMKSLGINTIIFRVFGNSGDRVYKFANPKSEVGVYFKTTRSPVIDDLLGKCNYTSSQAWDKNICLDDHQACHIWCGGRCL